MQNMQIMKNMHKAKMQICNMTIMQKSQKCHHAKYAKYAKVSNSARDARDAVVQIFVTI